MAFPTGYSSRDEAYMREALNLAGRGRGFTSPNPAVGAVLVRNRHIIGQGYHHQAGRAHAEIEALRDADRRGHSTKGATLYVTLEPCCTQGRTPPCTDAIVAAGIRRVVVATTDPNPKHAGRGLRLLRRHGLDICAGVLRNEAGRLNESFNHWIVHRTPFVTVKSALTLDGRIATAEGESKWITGPAARRHAMQEFRRNADAILVGINTILADDPALTFRGLGARRKSWRRIVLDSQARTPPASKVASDDSADRSLVVVGPNAPARRVAELRRRVTVVEAPTRGGRIDLPWLLPQLGGEGITSLLVEGGGEVNAAFLEGGLAQRIAFYYAPKILGGLASRPAIAGTGPASLAAAYALSNVEYLPLGRDWLITGLLHSRKSR